MRKPLIGVTMGGGDRPGVHVMREEYCRSVEDAHAVPVLLPPVGPEDVPPVLDRIDGVLLSGGGDVDPALYGQAPQPRLGRVERRRDDFELALTREALRRDRPIFAICRGLQLLNVAMGGTLLQDIPSEWPGGKIAAPHDAAGERWDRSHEVEVARNTRLHALLGQDRVLVNSFHHQAIGRVGEGLLVSARCPRDEVIEGVEAKAARFVLGVQWHPESFWRRPDSFQRLFDAHAEACRP